MITSNQDPEADQNISDVAGEEDEIEDMGALLDSVEMMKPLRRGDVVEGVVMRIDSEGVLVNFGHKAEGLVPPREMKGLSPEDVENLQEGDEILTLVVRTETAEGAAILSVDRAVGEKGWRILEKMLEAGETVEGKILGFNRGGVIVEAEGVNGFVPMSQLVSISRDSVREAQRIAEEEAMGPPEAIEGQVGPPEAIEGQVGPPEAIEGQEGAPEAQGSPETEGEAQKEAEPKPAPLLADAIGTVLQLKVLEVNRARNRAIFSERQVVRELRDLQKARLIQELKEGETRRGKVTGISSFGAFVDLGGADGLIHISELSWSSVSRPEEVVQVGEEVDVYVLRIDVENKKIALSLRRLQPEPWATLEERYSVGDLVEATVTKLTDFGAFARVEDSVEGLIHISELTDRRVAHPREVVSEGDVVKLKILRIEADRRRLGLSLKQAEEELDS